MSSTAEIPVDGCSLVALSLDCCLLIREATDEGNRFDPCPGRLSGPNCSRQSGHDIPSFFLCYILTCVLAALLLCLSCHRWYKYSFLPRYHVAKKNGTTVLLDTRCPELINYTCVFLSLFTICSASLLDSSASIGPAILKNLSETYMLFAVLAVSVFIVGDALLLDVTKWQESIRIKKRWNTFLFVSFVLLNGATLLSTPRIGYLKGSFLCISYGYTALSLAVLVGFSQRRLLKAHRASPKEVEPLSKTFQFVVLMVFFLLVFLVWRNMGETGERRLGPYCSVNDIGSIVAHLVTALSGLCTMVAIPHNKVPPVRDHKYGPEQRVPFLMIIIASACSILISLPEDAPPNTMATVTRQTIASFNSTSSGTSSPTSPSHTNCLRNSPILSQSCCEAIRGPSPSFDPCPGRLTGPNCDHVAAELVGEDFYYGFHLVILIVGGLLSLVIWRRLFWYYWRRHGLTSKRAEPQAKKPAPDTSVVSDLALAINWNFCLGIPSLLLSFELNDVMNGQTTLIIFAILRGFVQISAFGMVLIITHAIRGATFINEPHRAARERVIRNGSLFLAGTIALVLAFISNPSPGWYLPIVGGVERFHLVLWTGYGAAQVTNRIKQLQALVLQLQTNQYGQELVHLQNKKYLMYAAFLVALAFAVTRFQPGMEPVRDGPYCTRKEFVEENFVVAMLLVIGIVSIREFDIPVWNSRFCRTTWSQSKQPQRVQPGAADDVPPGTFQSEDWSTAGADLCD